MKDIAIALLQCHAWPLDVAGNLARLHEAARRAKAAGADLLVAPEMFLTGYDIGAAAATSLAMAANHPALSTVASIARALSLAIVVGHPSPGDAGQVFNSATCFGADGSLVGHYRKSHLFGAIDAAMFTPGSRDEPLFELYGWKLGMLICYDIEFPENVRRLALLGADAVIVPTANMKPYEFVSRHLVPTRAYENQLYVAYANYCGDEGSLHYHGLSCVCAPDGESIWASADDDELLLASLSVDRLARGRELNHHLALCRLGRQAGRL